METRDKINLILHKTEFVSTEEVLKNEKKNDFYKQNQRERLKFLGYIMS